MPEQETVTQKKGVYKLSSEANQVVRLGSRLIFMDENDSVVIYERLRLQAFYLPANEMQ